MKKNYLTLNNAKSIADAAEKKLLKMELIL